VLIGPDQVELTPAELLNQGAGLFWLLNEQNISSLSLASPLESGSRFEAGNRMRLVDKPVAVSADLAARCQISTRRVLLRQARLAHEISFIAE
jgi:hypothetical protein